MDAQRESRRMDKRTLRVPSSPLRTSPHLRIGKMKPDDIGRINEIFKQANRALIEKSAAHLFTDESLWGSVY
jgi:hypothetical protein